MTAGVSLAFVASYGRNESAGRIICYEVGDNAGILIEKWHYAETRPGFLAVDERRAVLFAECEDADRTNGCVVSYAIEPTGLRRLGSQPLGDPCHIALSPSGCFLITCCHRDGTVVVFPVESDGVISRPTHILQHFGRGPGAMQLGPQPHCATFDPSGVWLAVADAGNDTVTCYRLDENTGTLVLERGGRLKLPLVRPATSRVFARWQVRIR